MASVLYFYRRLGELFRRRMLSQLTMDLLFSQMIMTTPYPVVLSPSELILDHQQNVLAFVVRVYPSQRQSRLVSFKLYSFGAVRDSFTPP